MKDSIEKTPLLQLSLLTNSAKMSNSTASCYPWSSFIFVRDYPCQANTGPWNSSVVSNSGASALNQTGQAPLDALKACCPSPILPLGTDESMRCFSYCTNSGLEQALETQWCLGNYTDARPDYYFRNVACYIGDNSGATMSRETCGWGGLVILGLVASTAMVMF